MKIWAYVALAVLVVGAAGGVYRAGFVSAKAKYQDATLDAVAEALKLAKADWDANVEIAEAEIIVEERIVEVIREVEKEIPVVVERIVTLTPECADLGLDFARVFNDAITAGVTPDAGVADPTEPN